MPCPGKYTISAAAGTGDTKALGDGEREKGGGSEKLLSPHTLCCDPQEQPPNFRGEVGR